MPLYQWLLLAGYTCLKPDAKHTAVTSTCSYHPSQALFT